MNMEILHCEQQSEEWYQARLGKVTASHFKDVMNKKSGRETYMMRLLAERVTGVREESYSNKYMEDGIELEPEAREHYQWVTDNDVVQVGFVETTNDVGCSPDGLVGNGDGLLEIKCPKLTTHLGYIIRGVLPATYKPQVQGQLWVCKRKWCDFVSYCPDYEKQPMFCVRVERDEAYLSQLSAAVATFVTELQEMEKKL
jgi:putative phage-type endonuclease